MLARPELVRLYRDLADQAVLSVYLDVGQTDPAQRRAWKTRLEHEASLEARRVAAGEADEEEFQAALAHVTAALDGEGFVKGQGWGGFANAEGLFHHEALPVPMPDLVRFERGARVAPYVRGLKRLRPVSLAVGDRRRIRLFALQEGRLVELPAVVADQDLGDLSDGAVSKAGSRHSGQRGETASDRARRVLDESAERLWKEAMERAVDGAGEDGFLVLGGTPEAVGHLENMVPDRLRDRTETSTGMHVEMPLPELEQAVAESASVLNKRLQSGWVESVIDRARSGGRGVLGREGTVRALREMRVDTLLLSRAFVRDHPDLADHCVGTALAQDAEIEEVSGPGADLLDSEAGGIGARLRYRAPGG
ncbi:MAG: hypothetical protein HKN71_06960 [Gemmatimonadetes bacterium]|nr:hypothetical protein [Gemmatimonadota bacterium]